MPEKTITGNILNSNEEYMEGFRGNRTIMSLFYDLKNKRNNKIQS